MTTRIEHAAPGPGRDAGLAWHYGDPLREQRVLTTTAGVIDRSDRDVLVVRGADRLGWLHTICSQHVADLVDGESTESLVLSPTGHVEQHWQVTEFGETVWLDTEAGQAAQVLGYLDKMRFLKRVEPADVSADLAVLSLVGPTSAAVLTKAGLTKAGLPVPDAVGRAVGLAGGGFVRQMPWPAQPSFDLLVPRADATGVIAQLLAAGAQRAGLWAFEALRVEARRARLGLDTDHRTLAHEVDWIGSAVHLNKGCYRGQETVARVQNLGRPPRRLVLVHLSGESDELPAPGTPVEFAGRAVGFLGTAVHHFELGPIGLAVVKRTLPDDAALEIAGYAARIDPTG